MDNRRRHTCKGLYYNRRKLEVRDDLRFTFWCDYSLNWRSSEVKAVLQPYCVLTTVAQ